MSRRGHGVTTKTPKTTSHGGGSGPAHTKHTQSTHKAHTKHTTQSTEHRAHTRSTTILSYYRVWMYRRRFTTKCLTTNLSRRFSDSFSGDGGGHGARESFVSSNHWTITLSMHMRTACCVRTAIATMINPRTLARNTEGAFLSTLQP